MRLLVGTGDEAFWELNYDTDKNELSKITSVPSKAPAWLCVHNDSLFAVSEAETGKLSKFVSTDGLWSRQWETTSSSAGTCYCSVAQVGHKSFVLAANYQGHSVDVRDCTGAIVSSTNFQGSGPFEGRQESSHCHQVVQDLQSEYIYVNDLGADMTHRFVINCDGHLQQCGIIRHEPGSGPRHTTFHPGFPQLVYTICELSNRIVVHQWSDSPVLLQEASVLPISCNVHGKHDRYPQPASAGEIQITKDGKFLYASTRYLPEYQSDTIVWAPLGVNGLLGPIEHFNTGLIAPWHFSLNVNEAIMAVAFRGSNTICIYRRMHDGSVQEICRMEGINTPSCAIFLEDT